MKTRAAAYLAIAAYAGVLAVRLQPSILGDDAAITFRYVVRFVAGRGLTYNDHEHVLGLSNPLYALILAAFASVGFAVETVARAIGGTLFVVATLEAAALGEAFAGSQVGWLAGVFLATDPFFRSQSLGGMESVLSVCLGLATVLAILKDREVTAGIFLGLAIWTKFDAGLLALAVAAAWLIVHRRLPLRMALTAAAVAGPWFVFAWWDHGSPIPQSLVAKLGHGTASPIDHFWVVSFLAGAHRWMWCVLALASFVLWPRWLAPARAAAVILIAWFVFHAATFSVVNLGDEYAWYLTVLAAPPIILSSALPAVLVHMTRRLFARAAAVPAALILLLFAADFSFLDTYSVLVFRAPVAPWEAFDSDRRLAGVFLRQYARPDEIVQGDFGWVAFEVPNPVNDGSGLNSKMMRTPLWYVVLHGEHPETGSMPPPAPAGYTPLATFNLASDMFSGYSWFVVHGQPDSQIARRGARRLQRRLFELGPPSPFSSAAGLANVRLDSMDMIAGPPSGATFTVSTQGQSARLVFTPSVRPGGTGNQSGEVNYEIWLGRTLLYRRPFRAGGLEYRIAVSIADRGSDAVAFSLVTTAVAGESHASEAVWQDVKLVVGDAAVDVDALGDARLIQAWKHYNPDGS